MADLDEYRFRAKRGDILCLNEHVAHTDDTEVWLMCGSREVARITPPIGEGKLTQTWLQQVMDKHALEVATRLVRDLLEPEARSYATKLWGHVGGQMCPACCAPREDAEEVDPWVQDELDRMD